MTYSAASPIFAPSAATAAVFRADLLGHRSPALTEASAMFAVLADAGVDPAVFLGQFAAESSLGTAGYAVTTKNPGNIAMVSPGTGSKLPPAARAAYRAALIASHWTRAFGASAYSPGNGYTYAKFPTWRDGTRAYVALLRTYRARGWAKTIATMASRWLGMADATNSGYVRNIVNHANAVPSAGQPAPASVTSPAAIEESELMATPVDLTIQSPDIVGQLRQWLQVRKSPPASGFFHDNAGQADAQVVQLVATIVGHGTAYFRKGAISPSVLKLAQKLNAGNRFGLTPEYATSLETGSPEYARSLNILSGRITA